MPFAQAAALLEDLTGIRVSAATIRRQTEALGATAVALADAEVEQREAERGRESRSAHCRPSRPGGSWSTSMGPWSPCAAASGLK